jgi:hypothetical protein
MAKKGKIYTKQAKYAGQATFDLKDGMKQVPFTKSAKSAKSDASQLLLHSPPDFCNNCQVESTSCICTPPLSQQSSMEQFFQDNVDSWLNSDQDFPLYPNLSPMTDSFLNSLESTDIGQGLSVPIDPGLQAAVLDNGSATAALPNTSTETSTLFRPLQEHVSRNPFTAQRQPILGLLSTYPRDQCSTVLLQPETRPVTQEQLIAEVKGRTYLHLEAMQATDLIGLEIYAGLIMVEKKCVEIDAQQASSTNKLSHEQWQARIALHRTLLCEHHDFFLASHHPAASPALQRLASRYAMPARMWRHGIHSFLELLRHRLPDSNDHMLAFLNIAFTMMDTLRQDVPMFDQEWQGCLEALHKYQEILGETALEIPARRHLPEDFTMCAQAWAENCYPPDCSGGTCFDENVSELPSMDAARSERSLRLGIQLASVRNISYLCVYLSVAYISAAQPMATLWRAGKYS